MRAAELLLKVVEIQKKLEPGHRKLPNAQYYLAVADYHMGGDHCERAAELLEKIIKESE